MAASVFQFFIPATPGRPEALRPRLTPPPSHADAHQRLAQAERKRLALLEERRAKMAERVRYAKNVAERQRRRAAEAVCDQREALYGQLQHAAQKRAEYLQRQVAHFAADVQHARQVCHSQRQKDMRAARRNAAERERRAVGAATRIQRWWRQQTLRPLVEAFLATGVTVDGFRAASFDHAAATLVHANVLQAAHALLHGMTRTLPTARRPASKVARPFLSAYMMVAFPADVFQHPDSAAERDVHAAAGSLLAAFDRWTRACVRARDRRLLDECLAALHGYLDRFAEWRARDADALMDRLVQHLDDLDAFRDQVRGNPNEHSLYLPQIASERLRLLAQIQQLGGRAAVDKAVERHAARHADNLDAPVSSPDAVDTVAPSLSPPVRTSSPVPAHAIGATVAAAATSTGLDVDQLVHEMLLDPGWSPRAHLTTHVEQGAAPVPAAFERELLRLQRALRERDLGSIAATIASLYQAAAAVVPAGSFAAAALSDTFEPSSIVQQLQHEALDLSALLRVVVDVAAASCAPARDADVSAFKAWLVSVPPPGKLPLDVGSAAVVVEAVRRLSALLDHMRADLVCFRLEATRPVVMAHGVAYERRVFRRQMDSGQVDLRRTTTWLGRAAWALRERSASVHGGDGTEALHEIYAEAVVELAGASVPWTQATAPETWRQDVARLVAAQNGVQRCAVLSAIAMVVRNGFPAVRSDRQLIPDLLAALRVLLEADGVRVADLALQAHALIEAGLARCGQPPLAADRVAWLRGMLDKTLSLSDPLFRLVHKRVLEAVRACLRHDAFTSAFATTLPRAGLDVVESDLRAVVGSLLAVCRHNRAVFAPFYEAILARGAHP